MTEKALFWIVFLFIFTLKTHRTYSGQGDEPHYIVVAHSLLFDRDLDVGNDYDAPYFKNFKPDDHHVVRREGKERPFHSIGMSLLAVPILGVVHSLATILPRKLTGEPHEGLAHFNRNIFCTAMMVVAGSMAVFLFRLFNRLFDNPKASWIIALCFSLTPPLLSYGYLWFAEFPSAFMFVILFLHLLEKRPMGPVDALFLGFLPWMHPRSYVIAVLFLSLFWIQPSNLKKKWTFSGLIGLSWAGVFWMNYHLWGGFSPDAAWAGEFKTFEWKYVPATLPAIVTDRSFGLLVFAPIYMFFPVGLLMLWRRNKYAAAVAFLAIGAGLTPVVGYPCWWAGWSPGPRYIAPVVPFLALGVAAFLMAAWKNAAGKWIVRGTIGLSFVFSFLYWLKPKLLWNQEYAGVNEFLIHWFGNAGLFIQQLLPNFFQGFGWPQLQFLFVAGALCVINFAAYLVVKD